MKTQSFLDKWGTLIFFCLLVGMSFLYKYHHILFFRPFSMHQWRQTDCLGMTLSYYNGGMHFFQPALMWVSDWGNNKNASSECPLLYYTVALLWHIFGYHEFIYRGFFLLIAFAGLFALYKICLQMLHDVVWAIITALFLFTSPIFVFYANNFLTDIPALSVTLMGWYFFLRFYKEKKDKMFILAMFLFMLAGLNKISTLISVVPLPIIFVLEWAGLFKTGPEKVFNKPMLAIAGFTWVVLPAAGWAFYAIHYNNVNVNYFRTTPIPIWQCGPEEIKKIWNALCHDLVPQYFNKETMALIMLMFITVMVCNKKVNRFLVFLMVLSFAGSIAYILLWYPAFTVHDYYLIPVLIVIPLILITFLHFLRNNHHNIFTSVFLKTGMSLLLLFCIYYCAVHNRIRYSYADPAGHSALIYKSELDYWGWYHYYYTTHLMAYETIEPYNRSLGIEPTDRVISLPDQSPEITLYLMDQKGFTDFSHNVDSATMRGLIKHGAKYLFLNDTTYLAPMLQPFKRHKIGQYKNIAIYDLREYR